MGEVVGRGGFEPLLFPVMSSRLWLRGLPRGVGSLRLHSEAQCPSDGEQRAEGGAGQLFDGVGLDYPVTAWIQGFTQLHTFGAAQNTAAPAPAARVSRKITAPMKSESLSMLPPVLVLLRFTVVVELTGPGLNSQVQG